MLESETLHQRAVHHWEKNHLNPMGQFGGIPKSIRKSLAQMVTADFASAREPVLSKTSFVGRYKAGEFGNASPTWDSFFDWHNEHLGGNKLEQFHIRNRIAGAQTWYNVSKAQMAEAWNEATELYEPNQLYISAMAPLHLLNGELIRDHTGLRLFYSTVRKPMRDSLKEGGREATGLAAKLIIEQFMNVDSYEWAMALLDRYPDHVVEFTVVDRCWGTVPGFNTLFWEVRKY